MTPTSLAAAVAPRTGKLKKKRKRNEKNETKNGLFRKGLGT